MISEQISDYLFQIVEILPSTSLFQLSYDLEKLNSQSSNEVNFQNVTKISQRFSNPNARYLIEKLFEEWLKEQNGSRTLNELASLLYLLSTDKEKRKKSQKNELVWTGPASRIPIRQTRQVLSQLISNAQSELLIVSFVVFKIPEILSLLKNALIRGVAITCIFESPEESGGKIDFQGFYNFDDEILKQAKILIWDKDMRPISEGGKTGTLHAKVAVADQSISFISSANLTVNAMTLNMELGLLLYDKSTSQEIVEHFKQLTQDGVLRSK